MQWKKVLEWLPDNMPETEMCIVMVSDCGIVKRLAHKMWNEKNQSYSKRKEFVYKTSLNRGKQRFEDSDNKYVSVSINDKTYYVHRLVALAWIPNPLFKPCVNHINGIKNDNRVTNLEWVTNLENRRHAIVAGLPRKSIEKVTAEQVIQMKNMRLNGKSLVSIGKIYGVTGECVRHRTSKILSKKEKQILYGVYSGK